MLKTSQTHKTEMIGIDAFQEIHAAKQQKHR
jgi:hypothetical protein